MCAEKQARAQKESKTENHTHKHTLLRFSNLYASEDPKREAIANLISCMFAKFSGDISLLARCVEWDPSKVNKGTDILV